MKERKILIVDDDPQITSVLGKLLTGAGALVETVATCAAARDSIKRRLPDVAIMDVLLPDGSGLDLIKELSKMPEPHPFYVVLTNSVNAEHLAEAMEANITMFVQKADHDPREIVDMIIQHLATNS